jgi:hypothetical protein
MKVKAAYDLLLLIQLFDLLDNCVDLGMELL